MTENELTLDEMLKCLSKYADHESAKQLIKLLEELKRWRTDKIAPNVKNPLAYTSTLICHNCDHKDDYIEELETEIAEYREIGEISTCRSAVEICRAMIERGIEPENIEAYIAFEDKCVQKGFTIKGLLAAGEKQTAISREIIEGKYFCPKCHNLMPYPGYCGCGQRLY